MNPQSDNGPVEVDSKILSIVVPSYNSQDYLNRCIDTMLPLPEGVEIIIVNDGSTDDTQRIAEEYAAQNPDGVIVVNKPNGGHGSAINAGLKIARGVFMKVCDSDDWLNEEAYHKLVEQLDKWRGTDGPDVVVTNFVYEKQGKKRKHVMDYRNVLVDGKVLTWNQIARFRPHQYLLMHSLCYRTAVLREVNLELPEHTFYVDNLYAYLPMVAVRKLGYLDVDLYRYFIGRSDQSVCEDIMIKRIEQQLRVNKIMIDSFPPVSARLPRRLRWYMSHYLGVICVVSSILLIRIGSEDALLRKRALWHDLKRKDHMAYLRIRNTTLGWAVNLHGRLGRMISVALYRMARKAIGFS